MIKGTPVFDGIAVMEFSCVFYGTDAQPRLDAKAAFVQTVDVGERVAGTTHGFTTCSKWSADTRKKLEELCDAMEKDIAQRHFSDAASPAIGISPADVGGIGENLTDEEGAQQI